VESKALGVLASSTMPARGELARRSGKAVDKARKQLVGAARTLRQEGRIPSCSGPNESPASGGEIVHGAVLVSDISVMSNSQVPTTTQLQELLQTKGLMWHVVDLHELVRLIHAAAYFSDRDHAPAGTVLDALLVNRFERALEHGPLVRVLHGQ
jgi:hypothetical protein